MTTDVAALLPRNPSPEFNELEADVTATLTHQLGSAPTASTVRARLFDLLYDEARVRLDERGRPATPSNIVLTLHAHGLLEMLSHDQDTELEPVR